MDDLINPSNYFFQQGILGVIVVVLASVLSAVIIWQQRRIDKKDELIKQLQDQRILDADKYTSNYIAIAKETVATSKDHSSALSLLQRSVDGLTNGLTKLLEKS